MDYCVTLYAKKKKEEAFRIYVTDALKVLANNTATHERAYTMTRRYAEIIQPERIEPSKTTADVVSGIRKKLGGDSK